MVSEAFYSFVGNKIALTVRKMETLLGAEFKILSYSHLSY